MACTPIVRSFGYVPPEDELAEVQVGKDNRESVAEKIGRPLNTGIERDSAWYYVASEQQTVGPRAPKVTAREIVAIRFTDAGQVENIERFSVEDGRVVVLTARVTDPSVSDVGFLAGLFGNIGSPTGERIGQ